LASMHDANIHQRIGGDIFDKKSMYSLSG
jgi:hypothetical protein